jgi:hypothetical protein
LHGNYLFGGFTRRIVARFGRCEMGPFVVCCLFGTEMPGIADVAGCVSGT